MEGSNSDGNGLPNLDKNWVLGLGLRTLKQSPVVPESGESNANSANYVVKDSEKRLFGPFGSKITTFLSQFILHIAAIGDIVDGTDTTHDFNYFSLVYEWPKDVKFLPSSIFLLSYLSTLGAMLPLHNILGILHDNIFSGLQWLT